MRRVLAALLVLAFVAGGIVSPVHAAPPNTDPAAQEEQKDSGKEEKDEGNCAGGIPGIEQACDAGEALKDLPGKVADAPGDVAGSVAESAVDEMTEWMTDAATWTTKQIASGIEKTSTPELEASWYEERFGSMAALGLGLSMLVAMIALGSAALRRDPDALGATLIGMFRAGIGTGLVIALTVIALGVADGMTNYVAGETVGKESSKFWDEVGDAWGEDNFAGLGSSAIAFLLAFVQVIAALIVWIEMLVRQAAIYVAVLFMPFALAAGIWPAMREWQSRLGKVLFVLIAMKPVVVTVLALAGYAAKAGITGEAQRDVGVLLAAIVIFALAAMSPWALLHLISIDHESTRAAVRGAMGGRESTQRIGGALASPAGAGMRAMGQRGGSGRGGGGGPGSGGMSALRPGGPGGGGVGGGGSPARPSPGGSAGGGAEAGRPAIHSAGAVAAAAGMSSSGAANTGSSAAKPAGGQLGQPTSVAERAGAHVDGARGGSAGSPERPRPAAPAPRPGGATRPRPGGASPRQR